MDAALDKIEAQYAKAATAFENAERGTWEYERTQKAETAAWVKLMQAREARGLPTSHAWEANKRR